MAVTRAAGVGPKLATRIVSELKDKIGAIMMNPALAPSNYDNNLLPIKSRGPGTSASEAASALVNLGYSASEAMNVVSRMVANLGEQASVEELIRNGLRELAQKTASNRS